jgi:hypothetical protein
VNWQDLLALAARQSRLLLTEPRRSPNTDKDQSRLSSRFAALASHVQRRHFLSNHAVQGLAIASLVIDTNGIITLAFVGVDYCSRLPAEIRAGLLLCDCVKIRDLD